MELNNVADIFHWKYILGVHPPHNMSPQFILYHILSMHAFTGSQVLDYVHYELWAVTNNAAKDIQMQDFYDMCFYFPSMYSLEWNCWIMW